MLIRNDTPNNWHINNPILAKGEIGCAIDSKLGKTIMKIGDGVHAWNDLMIPNTDFNNSIQDQQYNNYTTFTSGSCSHAEGKMSLATGSYSHAEGKMSLALSPSDTRAYQAQSPEYKLKDISDALNKVARAAAQCGSSMQAAIANINAYARLWYSLSDAADIALEAEVKQDTPTNLTPNVIQSNVQNEEDNIESENLFDIPRFNIDNYKIDINTNGLFDF